MDLSVKRYKDINHFLSKIKVSLCKHPHFHIVNFEEEQDSDENCSITYQHDYFEVSFSLDYKAQLSIDDQQNDVFEYNLSFVSPGQKVSWETQEGSEDRDSTGYLVLFKPEFISAVDSVFGCMNTFPFFNYNTLPSYKLSKEQRQLFKNYFDLIYKEFKQNKEGAYELIKSYLTILLFTAKRELMTMPNSSYLQTRAREITFNFERAIKQTKHKKQSIKYFAQQLHISPIYLAECVKKVTGKTAKKIIDEYVLMEAKSLIKNSKKNIADIAYSMGFEDNSNFIKYFKKQTGLTPKAYKKNIGVFEAAEL